MSKATQVAYSRGRQKAIFVLYLRGGKNTDTVQGQSTEKTEIVIFKKIYCILNYVYVCVYVDEYAGV